MSKLVNKAIIIIALTSTAIFVLIVSVRLNRKQDHSTTDKIIPTVDVEHKAKNVTIIAHLISLCSTSTVGIILSVVLWSCFLFSRTETIKTKIAVLVSAIIIIALFTNLDIIGIFNLETTTITPRGREFLNYAQKNGAVVSLSDELPQSYVLADGAVVDTVYLSELSPAAMRRRAEKMIE
jgi:hypothetical protein